MESVKLSEEQRPYLDELNGYLETCKEIMSVELENQDIGFILEHFKRCQTTLASQGRMTELVHLIYGHVKGKLIESYDKDYKVHEFRMYCDGKLARWEALHQKTDRTIKSLDRYCQNIVTIISAIKKEMNL